MMSDPTTVDGTTVDELTGKVVLLIEEPRAWDEPAQMHRQLATKVKNYVRHIRGPNYDHQPSETIVRLVTARAPAPVSFEFFSRVSYELSKHGVSFEHQVGEDGLPVPIAPEEGVASGTSSQTSGRAAPSQSATEEPPAGPGDATAEAESAAWEPAIDSAPAGDAPLDEAPSAEEDEEEEEREDAAAEELEDRLPGLLPDFGPQGEDEVEELVSQLESLARPAEERPKYPPFFPEEEFGRAVPEVDLRSSEGADIEFLDPEFDRVAVETGAQTRAPMEMPRKPVGHAEARRSEADASLRQAVGSALASAAAGAAAWGLLAIPADQGAGFLALVVGLMVGMSVRIRGRRSRIFGVVAGVVTVLGSAMGVILATAVLTARHAEGGLSAVATLFADPGALGNALFTYYGWVDLAFAAVAVYIAARLAVARR